MQIQMCMAFRRAGLACVNGLAAWVQTCLICSPGQAFPWHASTPTNRGVLMYLLDVPPDPDLVQRFLSAPTYCSSCHSLAGAGVCSGASGPAGVGLSGTHATSSDLPGMLVSRRAQAAAVYLLASGRITPYSCITRLQGGSFVRCLPWSASAGTMIGLQRTFVSPSPACPTICKMTSPKTPGQSCHGFLAYGN